MKQIPIRADLAARLRDEAKRRGISVSRLLDQITSQGDLEKLAREWRVN